MYICVYVMLALPSVLGTWSMAIVLWLPFECYYSQKTVFMVSLILYLHSIIMYNLVLFGCGFYSWCYHLRPQELSRLCYQDLQPCHRVERNTPFLMSFNNYNYTCIIFFISFKNHQPTHSHSYISVLDPEISMGGGTSQGFPLSNFLTKNSGDEGLS